MEERKGCLVKRRGLCPNWDSMAEGITLRVKRLREKENKRAVSYRN